MVWFRIGALACGAMVAACGGRSPREDDYQATDLPFDMTVVWKADATLTESPEGMRCSGIVVEALSLGGIPIALADTAVSSDCFIETKDHGWLQFGAADILVSVRQEARFKELLAARRRNWNEYVHKVPFRGDIATPGGGEVKFHNDGTRTCTGLVVTSLNVANRDIELASTEVTAECLLRTKRDGAFQLRSAGDTWEVWMTAKQRDLLLGGQDPANP